MFDDGTDALENRAVGEFRPRLAVLCRHVLCEDFEFTLNG
jgi:hypothetical protein